MNSEGEEDLGEGITSRPPQVSLPIECLCGMVCIILIEESRQGVKTDIVFCRSTASSVAPFRIM